MKRFLGKAYYFLLLFAILLCLAVFIVVHIVFAHINDADDSAPVISEAPVIGFVELVSESEWRDLATQSVKDAAHQNNVQLLTIKSDRTLAAQKEAVRALIAYKVDVIIFSPVNVTGWDNILREAKNAGIPILLSDRTLSTKVEGAIYSFIGNSAVWQGEEAARFVMQYFADTTQTLNIVECMHSVGSSELSERSRGIRNVFDRNEKYDIYYGVSADGLYSKAYETFNSFFRNNQDQRKTDVFIGYSDSMTCGAIAAMEENGILPGTDIIVVSIGGTSEAMRLLREGKINCIVQSNYALGAPLIDTALKILNGEQVPPQMFLEGAVYTADLSRQEGNAA